MTGAKSRFKIIYENILDNFDRLLSKERIFDKKTLSSSIKSETVEKGKEGSQSHVRWLQKGSEMGVLYLGCIAVGIYG